MENYKKGKNVEESMSKDSLPIPDLPENFVWMQVNGGSKMRNVLGYAMKVFKDEKHIVWSGSGAAVGKTISCAEIMKRRFKKVHQITKISYRKVEEHWEPLMDELDPLVVVREIPSIHILLSKDPLNSEEPGYQAPGNVDAFWKAKESTQDTRRRAGPSGRKSKPVRGPYEHFSTATGSKQAQVRTTPSTEKIVTDKDGSCVP